MRTEPLTVPLLPDVGQVCVPYGAEGAAVTPVVAPRSLSGDSDGGGESGNGAGVHGVSVSGAAGRFGGATRS